LDLDVSGLWSGLRARVQRFSDTSHQPRKPNGGCIRGFIWAVLFEAVSALALVGLIYAFRTLWF